MIVASFGHQTFYSFFRNRNELNIEWLRRQIVITSSKRGPRRHRMEFGMRRQNRRLTSGEGRARPGWQKRTSNIRQYISKSLPILAWRASAADRQTLFVLNLNPIA